MSKQREGRAIDARTDCDTVPFDRHIAVCAFCYAVGRTTYMVEHVASWLIANLERLSEHDRAPIVREVYVEIELVRLGMECDLAQWMRVRTAIVGHSA